MGIWERRWRGCSEESVGGNIGEVVGERVAVGV